MRKRALILFSILVLFSFLISGCAPKDTTPPTVLIISPQNGQTVSGTVTIHAIAVDNVGVSKVIFYIDGNKVGEDTTSPYEYSWDTDTLQYGSTHTIIAEARDNAGNVGVSSVVQVTIGDTQAPQVTITSPQNGQTVSGIVTIQVSVVDKVSPLKKTIQKAPSGILKVEFYIDGSKVGEDATSPYEYSWNTDNLKYGSTHTIQAKAYDNAGNVGESNVVQVTIGDTQAPQITITNPQNGQTVSGIVTIQVSVVDKVSPAKKTIQKAPSGISKVEFYIDGSKVGEDTSSPYEYSWNTILYANGTHAITTKTYDNAGNIGSTSIMVNVQNYVWQKTYGGSSWDWAYSIQQTTDGGYIVAGWTDSFGAGNSDIYIIKLDKNGNKLWEKIYGGSGDDEALSIHQTTDGGYIVAGWTTSFGAGGYDVYVIKLDANGNKLWEKTFGGSSWDWAYSIQQTTDGGYIVAGSTYSFGAGYSDVYIIKLDENGNKLWEKTYGGSGWDGACSIQQTNDGGYIVAGSTDSFGAGREDVYVIKLDENGNKIWEKTFGGGSDDIAYSIQQTTDGGYIVVGKTESFGAGDWDIYVIKLDTNGNKVWEKTYGGSDYDEAHSIQQTNDGGYIVAGFTKSFGAGYSDVYIIKLDASGNTGPYPPTQGAPSALKSMEKPLESPFDKMFPHGFLKK